MWDLPRISYVMSVRPFVFVYCTYDICQRFVFGWYKYYLLSENSLWEFTLLYHSSFSRPELLHGSRISVTIYSNFLLERKDLHYKVNLKEFKVINYVSVTHRLSDTLFRNTFRTNVLSILRESLRDLKNKTIFVIPKIILNLERSLQKKCQEIPALAPWAFPRQKLLMHATIEYQS